MQSMGIEMSRRERLADLNEDALLLEPAYFDDALIGIASLGATHVALYSLNKVIDLLIENEGLSEEDALEHYEYNMVGSYGGDNYPIFLEESFDD